jgi:hypothetical protein
MFETPGSRVGRKTANRLRQGYFAESHPIGVVASGTVTVDPRKRPLTHYTNGGAHTFAPPAEHCSFVVDVTNNASAGAITTSSWGKVTGDTLTTANNSKFKLYCNVGSAFSHLHVQAGQ